MQNEPNILLVITHEDLDTSIVTHCHFKNKMSPEEKQSLVQALINTVDELLKDTITDDKIVYPYSKWSRDA